MREHLDGVLIAQTSLSEQVGELKGALHDYGEVQGEVGGHMNCWGAGFLYGRLRLVREGT